MASEAELCERHLRLARRLAARFCRSHPTDRDEAQSDAMLGLLRAVRSHRPEKASLATWIAIAVRSELLDGLRRRDHLSRTLRSRADAEARRLVPLDVSRCGLRSRERPADAAAVLSDDVGQLRRFLWPDELQLLTAYFGREETLDDIAAKAGISQSLVSRRLAALAEKLAEMGFAGAAARRATLTGSRRPRNRLACSAS